MTAKPVSAKPVSATPVSENVPMWVQLRRRRARRRDSLQTAANLAGYFVVQLLAILQFSVGAFRRVSYADDAVNVLLVVSAASVLMLLVAPQRTIVIITRFMHVTGAKITDLIVNILLVMLFVLTLPFAATLGRRGFLRRHRASAPWVEGTSWRGRSTWTRKTFPAADVNQRNRGTFMRAVFFFVGQRNWFLLAIALLLLALGTFLAIASSPVLTPFIYPLF